MHAQPQRTGSSTWSITKNCNNRLESDCGSWLNQLVSRDINRLLFGIKGLPCDTTYADFAHLPNIQWSSHSESNPAVRNHASAIPKR
mmetsp:Transcript_1490/g.3201  ORF Transcript_1490/g.3201 Transcript_1490/m.3201 type:complete len:87 (+) Transcript_1490:236-496(+)